MAKKKLVNERGEGPPLGAENIQAINRSRFRFETESFANFERVEIPATLNPDFFDKNPRLRAALAAGTLNFLPNRDDPSWNLQKRGFKANAVDTGEKNNLRMVYVPVDETKIRGVNYVGGVLAQIDYSGPNPKLVAAVWMSGGGATYDGIPKAALPGTSVEDMMAAAKKHPKFAPQINRDLQSPVMTAIELNFNTAGFNDKNYWRVDGKASPIVHITPPDHIVLNRDGFLIHGNGNQAWRHQGVVGDMNGLMTAGCWTTSTDALKIFIRASATNAGIDTKGKGYEELFKALRQKGGTQYAFVMHPDLLAPQNGHPNANLTTIAAQIDKTRLAEGDKLKLNVPEQNPIPPVAVTLRVAEQTTAPVQNQYQALQQQQQQQQSKEVPSDTGWKLPAALRAAGAPISAVFAAAYHALLSPEKPVAVATVPELEKKEQKADAATVAAANTSPASVVRVDQSPAAEIITALGAQKPEAEKGPAPPPPPQQIVTAPALAPHVALNTSKPDMPPVGRQRRPDF